MIEKYWLLNNGLLRPPISAPLPPPTHIHLVPSNFLPQDASQRMGSWSPLVPTTSHPRGYDYSGLSTPSHPSIKY